VSQYVYILTQEQVTWPPLPLSNLSLAGFGYGNGALGAGVFPEEHPQPGTLGAGVGTRRLGQGCHTSDLLPPPGFPGVNGFRNGESDSGNKM
jgi:hypothetical protein